MGSVGTQMTDCHKIMFLGLNKSFQKRCGTFLYIKIWPFETHNRARYAMQNWAKMQFWKKIAKMLILGSSLHGSPFGQFLTHRRRVIPLWKALTKLFNCYVMAQVLFSNKNLIFFCPAVQVLKNAILLFTHPAQKWRSAKTIWARDLILNSKMLKTLYKLCKQRKVA